MEQTKHIEYDEKLYCVEYKIVPQKHWEDIDVDIIAVGVVEEDGEECWNYEFACQDELEAIFKDKIAVAELDERYKQDHIAMQHFGMAKEA